MLFQRKYCLMVAFVTYFVLILLFFTLREKHLSSPCDSKHCIRLCCGDLYTCNDSIMSENFNKSFAGHWLTAVSEEKVNGTFESVKVLFGRPSCKLDLITDDNKWKFDYHSSVYTADFSYDHDEYCFQDKEAGGKIEWNLLVCQTLAFFQRKLNHSLVAIDVLIYIAIIFIYAYFKNLRRGIHGKFILSLMIGLALTQFSVPFVREMYDDDLKRFFSITMFFAGFLFSQICINVMIIDVWRTFNKNRLYQDENQRFKSYRLYAFGCSGILSALAIADFFNVMFAYRERIFAFVLFLFTIMALVDLVLLTVTAIRVLKMARSARASDHSWFEEESQRFWTYAAVFTIMVVVCPLELYTWTLFRQFYVKIVIDVIKCFSVIVFFVTFVFNEKAQKAIFKDYDVLDGIRS